MKILITISVLLLGQITIASTAAYEVPTSQNELKASSVFKIEEISIKRNIDNTTTIKYVVPEELTGLRNELDFTGNLSSGSGDLTSDQGYMKCLSNRKKMMCTVTYQNLDFDSGLALQKMSNKFKDEELNNRLTVQEKFSTDPVGIIHIRLNR
ncbi:MAG: hypothetical protein ABL930_13370 [Pseudobdellovibrio sp.]